MLWDDSASPLSARAFKSLYSCDPLRGAKTPLNALILFKFCEVGKYLESHPLFKTHATTRVIRNTAVRSGDAASNAMVLSGWSFTLKAAMLPVARRDETRNVELHPAFSWPEKDVAQAA